jgi:hypothetical protein
MTHESVTLNPSGDVMWQKRKCYFWRKASDYSLLTISMMWYLQMLLLRHLGMLDLDDTIHHPSLMPRDWTFAIWIPIYSVYFVSTMAAIWYTYFLQLKAPANGTGLVDRVFRFSILRCKSGTHSLCIGFMVLWFYVYEEEEPGFIMASVFLGLAMVLNFYVLHSYKHAYSHICDPEVQNEAFAPLACYAGTGFWKHVFLFFNYYLPKFGAEILGGWLSVAFVLSVDIAVEHQNNREDDFVFGLIAIMFLVLIYLTVNLHTAAVFVHLLAVIGMLAEHHGQVQYDYLADSLYVFLSASIVACLLVSVPLSRKFISECMNSLSGRCRQLSRELDDPDSSLTLVN